MPKFNAQLYYDIQRAMMLEDNHKVSVKTITQHVQWSKETIRRALNTLVEKNIAEKLKDKVTGVECHYYQLIDRVDNYIFDQIKKPPEPKEKKRSVDFMGAAVFEALPYMATPSGESLYRMSNETR